MLGAGSVPVLGVLCACRTRPAIRCGIFHQVRRSASPGNQPLWFSGARQRWPWAALVLGRLLAWPSRRVVIHSPQPLRRSVTICARRSLSLDPRCSASPTLRTLLLSLTCLCVWIYVLACPSSRRVFTLPTCLLVALRSLCLACLPNCVCSCVCCCISRCPRCVACCCECVCVSPAWTALGTCSPALGCVGRSGAQLSWRPVLSGDWLLGAASLLSAALAIGDQPLWRSAALAISRSGDQPLWQSATLAISRSGDLWRSAYFSTS